LTPDDVAICAYLRQRALTGEPDAFGSQWIHESQRNEQQWRHFIETRTIFVAFNGDQPVGIAGGGPRDGDGAALGLYSMWVDPDVRGLGVSRRLIELVEEWARGEGAAFLDLDVVTHLAHPIALYRRCGFSETGRRSFMERDPSITLMEMRKKL
jgi:GNAT superfamily N-acetyltransferase